MWGSHNLMTNSAIQNTIGIFEIQNSTIIIDLNNLGWIIFIQKYINKHAANSLKCCCKKLNDLIKKQENQQSGKIYNVENSIVDESNCVFCGEWCHRKTGDTCRYNFPVCIKCAKLYHGPIRVGTNIIVEKSRLFPHLNSNSVMIPDYYVRHLKNQINDKYEYWKLAINCFNFAMNLTLNENKKPIKYQLCKNRSNCTNKQVGHLINFVHKK